MEYLRWIILVSGIVLVLIIYLTSPARRKKNLYEDKIVADDLPSIKTVTTNNESEYQDGSVDLGINSTVTNDIDIGESGVENITGDVIPADDFTDQAENIDIDNQVNDTVTTEDTNSEQIDTEQPQQEDDLLIIYVIARDSYFTGNDLSRLINHQQLKFGDMEIYHAYDDQGKIIFSMSNMLNPGHFYPDKISEMQTPGVTLFMQAKLVSEPEAGFIRMLNCAETISRELGGDLCDAKRKKLNEDDLEAMKSKVSQFSTEEQSATSDNDE